MADDHRRYPRAPLTGTVKCYEWNRPFHCTNAEISAEGMFLRTPDTFAEGAMLTVRLRIPGLARAFTVLAKVVRTVRGNLLRPPGVGIRFLDLSSGNRKQILEYVDRRAVGAL